MSSSQYRSSSRSIRVRSAVEAAGLQETEESSRERWARLGVTVNELALRAL